MNAVPLALSGPVTIALIVILGIFVYPWLLRRPRGRLAVAITTTLVAALFALFEASDDNASTTGIVLAGLLGLAPTVAGVIVARLQRGASS